MNKPVKLLLLLLALALFPTIASSLSIEGSTAVPEPDYYISGADQDIAFLVWNNSTDAEWLAEIIITFPADWAINSITHYAGPNNNGAHDWFMEGTGTNVARWYNDGGYGEHYSQSDHYYAVNVTVPASASGIVDVDVDLYGDIFGSEPHELFLTVQLFQLEENIYINPYESYGEVCAGDSFTKELSIWNNTPYELDVDLSYLAEAGYTVLFTPNPVENIPPGDEAIFSAVVTTPASAADAYTSDIEIQAVNQINGVTETYTSTAWIYATTYTNYCTSLVEPLNENRLDAAVVSYAGQIYAFGGYHSPAGNVSSVEIYDPATDTWTYGTPMPDPIAEYPGSAANVGDQVLVQNSTGSTWKIYNITSDSWSDITAPFAQNFGAKLVTYLDKIYMTGGYNGSAVTDNFYEYDIATDTWTPLPSMPNGSWWHTSFASNGRIFVMGGYHGLGASYTLSTECWAYDLAAGTWGNVSPMPAGRWGAAGTFNGQVFLVAGGNDGSTGADTIFSYNPSLDTWDTVPAVLPEATFRFNAAAINDSVYTVGGFSVTQSFYGYDYVQKIQNCAFQSGPDPAIFSANISFDPPAGQPGDLVEITAVVMNIGDQTCDSGNAEFYYALTDNPGDMTLIDTIPFGPILPGKASEPVICMWDTTGLDYVAYRLTVILTDILPFDIDYTNNEATREFNLPVQLTYFTATGAGNKAFIRWGTQSEIDNLGWNVYRLKAKKISPFITYTPVLLNDELIPGYGTSSEPHSYNWTDTIKQKGAYFYILEAVSTYGTTEQWRTKLQWMMGDPIEPAAKPRILSNEEIRTSDPIIHK